MRLLQGVLDLCRAVELPCIAEHVETEQQVDLLRGMGCRFGQGYWLARPMAAEQARQVGQRRPRRFRASALAQDGVARAAADQA